MEDAAGSAVYSLALGSLALPGIVDTLLGTPIVDAGRVSPFPLDLAMSAALSLVESACRQAVRGGAAAVVTSTQGGAGFGAAVRPAVVTETGAVSVQEVDLSGVPGCADVEAVAVVAQHGTYSLCGRREGGRFRGIHSSDPLVADLLSQRLARLGGTGQR